MWLHDCFYWYIDVYQAGWHFSWQIFDTMAVCDGLCDVRVADKAAKFVIMSHIIWRHNFIRCNKPEERKKRKVWNLFDLVYTKPHYKNWSGLGVSRLMSDRFQTVIKCPKDPDLGVKGLLFVCPLMKSFEIQNFRNTILCFGPANRPWSSDD